MCYPGSPLASANPEAKRARLQLRSHHVAVTRLSDVFEHVLIYDRPLLCYCKNCMKLLPRYNTELGVS